MSAETRQLLIAIAPAAVVRIVHLGTEATSWLPLLLAALVISYFWAAVFSRLRARALDTGWLPHALIFCLLLPVPIPPAFAVLALSFGLVFGCHIFGGSGRTLVHPALLAAIFLAFAYPAQVDLTAWAEADPIASFWFAGACLLGALWLIAVRRDCAMTVAGGVLGAAVAGVVPGEVSPLSHLMLGHFAFALAFIATDRSTQPKSTAGRLIFGVLFGALTIVLRTANPDHPEGTWAALLLASLVVPLIDHLTLGPANGASDTTDASSARR